MGIKFLILQEDKKKREDHTANITAKLVGSFIFNGFLFPTLILFTGTQFYTYYKCEKQEREL